MGSTIEEGPPFPLSLAKPYVENLLELGRADEALEAWRDMEKLGIVAKPRSDDEGNLVFNGDFEQVPLNVGFDWRARATPYVALDFSDAAAHTGKVCLRIDFTVSRNESYMPLYQWVAVSPNRGYRLTAFVRSQDITSDSGPRLQVFGPGSHARSKCDERVHRRDDSVAPNRSGFLCRPRYEPRAVKRRTDS